MKRRSDRHSCSRTDPRCDTFRSVKPKQYVAPSHQAERPRPLRDDEFWSLTLSGSEVEEIRRRRDREGAPKYPRLCHVPHWSPRRSDHSTYGHACQIICIGNIFVPGSLLLPWLCVPSTLFKTPGYILVRKQFCCKPSIDISVEVRNPTRVCSSAPTRNQGECATDQMSQIAQLSPHLPDRNFLFSYPTNVRQLLHSSLNLLSILLEDFRPLRCYRPHIPPSSFFRPLQSQVLTH